MLFAPLRRRRAARLCAQRLPLLLLLLLNSYGASEFYTPAQIRTAAAKSGLLPQYLQLAYAAFLPEPMFLSVAAGDWQELRNLVARYRPARPAYGVEPALENMNAVSGGGLSGP